jgi:hypothetical protein
MNIYVASSWRNEYHPRVVRDLREIGHEVYDFRAAGFHWSEIDTCYQGWTADEYIKALDHPLAQQGYQNDLEAMHRADVCVLVLPCGRSAHLEAGWFAGSVDKKLIILLDTAETYAAYGHTCTTAPCAVCGDINGCHYARETVMPELSNKMADAICTDLYKVFDTLDEWSQQ